MGSLSCLAAVNDFQDLASHSLASTTYRLTCKVMGAYTLLLFVSLLNNTQARTRIFVSHWYTYDSE